MKRNNIMSETISKLIKRSGEIVDFDQDKIARAIYKAALAVGVDDHHLAKKLTDQVAIRLNQKFHKNSIPAVEEVQDIVEEILIESKLIKIAKAYILYRDQHRQLRDINTATSDDKLLEDYLGRADWRLKENSNMSFSVQGLNNYIASSISARYWLNKMYPENIRQAHINGDIHIHDLGLLAPYCCGWDLKDLLLRGFRGVSEKVQSNAPKHFRSALGQIINFFYTLQGEAAGAQAFANFDTYLAPFIRYDNLNFKEVKQGLQEFMFNINVPTRVGFQTPFTNITLDVTPSPMIGEENVIIGGEVMPDKYKDFQAEMDMFNQVFAEVMLAGDSSGRVFGFPIPTYNIDKDFDWDRECLKPAWEMTAKYGIPYFSNFVNSDMKRDDARSMCPLAGDEKVLIKSSRGRDLEYSAIRNIYEGNSRQEEYEIYSDGRFIKGKFNRFANQKMLEITLVNGHKLKISEEHLNFVVKNKKDKVKVLKGKELSADFYLPYSLKTYQGEGGNYDLGFFVGAYAGDGSFDGDSTVVFSLEEHFKKDLISKLEKISKKYFNAHSSIKADLKTKLVTLKIHSRAAVGLCRDFVNDKERNKHYSARLFGSSLEFRQGVFDGHYRTDGGNKNRIYTSSVKMVETLNMLAASLGTATSLYEDKRDNRYGRETNYAVLFYKLNREQYSNIWFKKDDKLWVKIKSIKKIANSTAYCFEVKSGAPVFTVGTTGILTHNCRLRLDNRELRKRGGGLFGANPLTGSLGVVTLNLARVGYLSKSREEFKERILSLMEISKESLEIKRKIIEKFTDDRLYPYSMFYLEGIKEHFGTYWKNHFSTIGINGMNEAVLNLMGKDISTPEGHAFAAEILDFMREKLMDFQNETNNLYNLEATPGEGCTYRFAKKDQQLYPGIICANSEAVKRDGANPYYTNSTHLHVNFSEDIFSALDLQDDLQTKYTGGTVLHGYLGERLPNGDAAKRLVKKIVESYRLPYFTITPTFSICPKHGYLSGEHKYCPKCDEEIGYKESVEEIRAANQ
jgi:anaerobic ribonucleoside-triphosphate reductase